jgi:hypothetical protein
MDTNQRTPNCQKLADRAGDLARTVNQLIADIESDIAAPGEAAFHAKDAFAALQAAHLALVDAAREQTARHYQGMAQQAAA